MILAEPCEKHDAPYDGDSFVAKTAFDKHFDRPKDIPVAYPTHKHIKDCHYSQHDDII